MTMIEIEKIITEGKGYRYHFPTIDFKFNNTGSTTGFLWKFVISVLEVEIDKTPTFEFKFTVTNGKVMVNASNKGWGSANQCEFLIDNPVIKHIFTGFIRSYEGDIKSGEEKIIFSIDRKTINIEKFEKFHDQFIQIRNNRNYGIELKPFCMKWKCKDEYGKNIEGIEHIFYEDKELFLYGKKIHQYHDTGRLFLTENGFFFENCPLYPMPVPSYTTYCSIINEYDYPHEYIYPISRKIAPGDIERFHILIGSSKSCCLRLRFKFYIDEKKIIESEEFIIDILNPRDSTWYKLYKDGAELKRDIKELELRGRSNELSYWGKEENNRKLKRMRSKALYFPFIKLIACPRCGYKTEEGSRFCENCGYDIIMNR